MFNASRHSSSVKIQEDSNNPFAVKVWEIPDDFSNAAPLSTAKAQLKGHTKRVDVVKFHPVAEGVLASASVDKTLRVWDVNAQGTSTLSEFSPISFALLTFGIRIISLPW